MRGGPDRRVLYSKRTISPVSKRKADVPDADRSQEVAKLRAEVKSLRASLKRSDRGVETMLRRRGFQVYKKEPAQSLLVPARAHLDRYYATLHKYSFRLFLRDVIKHQDGFDLEIVTRYATPSVTSDYVQTLLTMKLVRKRAGLYELARRPVTSFGPTLEWYIAEVLKREFGCEAIWGVKFRRPLVGGDYDVIALLDCALLYAEVKSSPPKQIYDSEVAAFLDRVQDLSPDIALFLMDTELRMKDKIVPMFEKELSARFKQPPRVERMERELFQISDRVFIVNAKEEVLRNIQTVLAWHYRRARGIFPEKG